MSENIYSQINLRKHPSKKEAILEFLKKESVLVIAVSLAILSCLISTPKLSYIDFKVLILLFNLMIVVAAFKELKVLDSIAISLLKRCHSYTSISTALVFITFVSSMVVTNDVALITFVPLTIVVARKANIDVLKIVIFQTLAANLGSSFTPMGNPQNLFIYSYFNLKPVDFFIITGPILLLSIVFLLFLIYRCKKMNLDIDLENVQAGNKKHIYIFSGLFLIILLSVFHLIDYKFTLILTVLTVLALNKKLFFKVDFSLLITFIGFFIFIGNISTLDSLKIFMENILKSSNSTFISSLLSSQVISNVPATMLLSSFTDQVNALLLGVNIGGMGTLIASLASVISYKIYNSEFNNTSYIQVFTIYNILGLLIMGSVAYIFLI